MLNAFLPVMPTHEAHHDDDVTPRLLRSTSSRLVHSNQGRIKLKYRFFIIKKKKKCRTGGAILLIYWIYFLPVFSLLHLFLIHLKEHRLLNCVCRHRTRQMM
jgi:hypothetical protein